MDLVFLFAIGVLWGAAWHYWVPGGYWLASISAAICAGATCVGLTYLLVDSVGINAWILGASFSLPITLAVGLPVRLKFRSRSMLGFCRQCGYSLKGLPLPRCPECGLTFDPQIPLSLPSGRLSFIVPLQVLFAVVFLGADALMSATVLFAGEERLFDRAGLWLWIVLGLSCAAVPWVGRIRTKWGVAVSALACLSLIAGLLVWFSRFA